MTMVFSSPHDIGATEVFTVLAANSLDIQEVPAGGTLVSSDTTVTASAEFTSAIINANMEVSNSSTVTFTGIAGGWNGVTFGLGLGGQGQAYNGRITLAPACALVMNGKSATVEEGTQLVITKNT
jgi:hypothetical protein